MLGVLDCKSIGELDDGRAELIINSAIIRALDDLDNRGKDGKPRTITITLTGIESEGNVYFDVQAGVKIPAQRTGTTKAKIRQKKGRGGLAEPQAVFSFESPDEPDQRTIHDFIPTKDDGEIIE